MLLSERPAEGLLEAAMASLSVAYGKIPKLDIDWTGLEADVKLSSSGRPGAARLS